MKHKLSLLVVLIVLATTGIAALQVSWLTGSYKISKEKITTDAKIILDEAIVEHKELVAERVKRLLKKAINPKDIETKILWRMPDSQNVELGYRTKRYPNASWASFKVSLKELTKVQSNPYPLLLKRINDGNLDILYGTYSTFIGIVNYEPNTWEEKLQDSLMRCFYLHEDTATLNKIIKKRFDKIGYHFITQVIHQKGIDKIYNNEQLAIKSLNLSAETVVEMVINEKRRTTLTEKLDSLHAHLLKLGEKGHHIYIAKPILDDINTILLDKVSVIILSIAITPLNILSQMLFSLFGSVSLLLLIGFCLIYMFYTILKQKRLSEIKDDFISNVSHELKTPVSTTLAAIQGMQHFGVLKDEEKTEQYLGTAAKEMNRLSTLIDTILNSAIYERSDFELQLVKFNLKEMLMEIINIQQLHSKKEVKIELNYLTKQEILADKTHLYNVFINLIDNAIKYGKEKVSVKIECTDNGQEIKIQVTDNGNGIPMAYQKHIFDKFFRVPSPTDHSIKGYGLGLNYVKNIIENHKGRISLPKSDSNGSTFEINLPQ